MNKLFNEIREEHARLLEASETREKDWIPQARDFLKTISKAGSSIGDAHMRSQLRAILRFWEDLIFSETDEMPISTLLEPAVKSSDPPIIDPPREQPPSVDQSRRSWSLWRWLLLAFGLLAVALTAQLLLATLFAPSIRLETPQNGQPVYCMSEQICYTSLSGIFKPRLPFNGNLGILALVRPRDGVWYSETGDANLDDDHTWTATIQLADRLHSPTEDDTYELVAIGLDRTLILAAQRLRYINDYQDLKPVTASEEITITISSDLWAQVFPQFAELDGQAFAFPQYSQSLAIYTGGAKASAVGSCQLHMVYTAADGSFAGWGVGLQEGVAFDASSYENLRLQLALEYDQSVFEVKLKDSNGLEMVVQSEDYAATVPGQQDVTIPLDAFAMQDDSFALDQLQVVTLGFNQELGDAALSLVRITFE